jgi:hypothetical protein
MSRPSPGRGRPRTRPGLFLAAAAFCFGACDSATDVTVPRIESVETLSAAALVQPLRIVLDRVAPLAVEYWTDDGPRLRAHSPAARVHDVALARLRPGRQYRYEIGGEAGRGSFTSGSLPDDLARITLRANGTPTVPLVLLHLFDPAGFRGYAITDAAGEIVWYWRTVDFPFGASRRANGNFVFMDKGRGLVEVTLAGDVVHELPQDLAQRELHHDAITTPRNTVLFIAFDERTVDDRRVRGEAIWEWTPETGEARERWSSWDHFSLASDRGPRFGLEWMHANALSFGARGNVLLSVHYFNQILSLSPDFTTIEWRLGGINATATVPGEAFSGQHTPTEIAPDRVLLFDNGIERGGPSRAVELEIVGDVAHQRWEWFAPNANFSTAVSSARRLPNGHTLVGFGMSEGLNGSSGPTEVYEITADGTPVWHLEVAGTTVMFRAEPLAAVATETVVHR